MGNQKAMSLVELIIMMAVMSILALGSASMFVGQMKSANFVDYQVKRTQLRSALMGQFLSSSGNCKCLFNGSTEFVALNMATPGITLSVNPTQVTNYNFPGLPGDCTTAVADPNPFISNNVTIDGMRSALIQLKDVRWDGSAYSGDLSVDLTSVKEVAGPKDINLTIRVALQTVPGTPGHVVFSGCSMSSASGVTPAIGTCPAGQVLTGYDAYGNLVCTTMSTPPAASTMACTPPAVMVGFDLNTGVPNCQNPWMLGTCPNAGEVLVGYNSITGAMICQPPTYQ